MRSCLYAGHVTHHRAQPVSHDFRRPVLMAYLDLEEVATLQARLRLFGAGRYSLASFRWQDHQFEGQDAPSERIRQLVGRVTARQPQGPVRLLTQLRWMGHFFSPLNLYYCFARGGQDLEAVVAEVSNTPWGEQHRYVLPCACPSHGSDYRYRHVKEFHVSPFLPMELQYDWQFNIPEQETHVRIGATDSRSRVFVAHLSLRRRPLTDRELLRGAMRYPWMTAQIVAAIYWQAFQLWWKKCPTYTHPKRPAEPTTRGQQRLSASP